MPNSRHSDAIVSPSLSRITNRIRSSMTELSFHGILLSAPFGPKSVTHVSGTFCYPCLGTDTKPGKLFVPGFPTAVKLVLAETSSHRDRQRDTNRRNHITDRYPLLSQPPGCCCLRFDPGNPKLGQKRAC